MDLNNIELPASVVADLYRDFLIGSNDMKENILPGKSIERESAKPGVETTGNYWKSLGNNQKNILIVVNHKEAVHLPDQDYHFLTGILGACKLSVADVAIINLNNYENTGYKELTAYFKASTVFLFGIDPVTFGLPMNFPHFQVQTFQNRSFLYSPDLRELENDKLLKSRLWVCLKRIFTL